MRFRSRSTVMEARHQLTRKFKLNISRVIACCNALRCRISAARIMPETPVRTFICAPLTLAATGESLWRVFVKQC